MMDDRELALIAAFRLHEVASRLSVLSRVARTPQLKETLLALSEQLSNREREMTDLGQSISWDAGTQGCV